MAAKRGAPTRTHPVKKRNELSFADDDLSLTPKQRQAREMGNTLLAEKDEIETARQQLEQQYRETEAQKQKILDEEQAKINAAREQLQARQKEIAGRIDALQKTIDDGRAYKQGQESVKETSWFRLPEMNKVTRIAAMSALIVAGTLALPTVVAATVAIGTALAPVMTGAATMAGFAGGTASLATAAGMSATAAAGLGSAVSTAVGVALTGVAMVGGGAVAANIPKMIQEGHAGDKAVAEVQQQIAALKAQELGDMKGKYNELITKQGNIDDAREEPLPEEITKDFKVKTEELNKKYEELQKRSSVARELLTATMPVVLTQEKAAGIAAKWQEEAVKKPVTIAVEAGNLDAKAPALGLPDGLKVADTAAVYAAMQAKMGKTPDKPLTLDDMMRNEDAFFEQEATGNKGILRQNLTRIADTLACQEGYEGGFAEARQEKVRDMLERVKERITTFHYEYKNANGHRPDSERARYEVKGQEALLKREEKNVSRAMVNEALVPARKWSERIGKGASLENIAVIPTVAQEDVPTPAMTNAALIKQLEAIRVRS